jgi:hypothetical protein
MITRLQVGALKRSKKQDAHQGPVGRRDRRQVVACRAQRRQVGTQAALATPRYNWGLGALCL